MADNITLNPGALGATLAADDIGGVHHQLVKLEYGILDDATLVSTTNPLPINAYAGGTALAAAGGTAAASLRVNLATDVALPAGTNAIGKLAANSGVDIGDVDVLTMPGTAAEAAALPSAFVVVAGDDGADTHPLQVDATTGDLKVTLDSETVAISAASLPLPTGAATAANQTTIIGHVDGVEALLTTIDADTGALAGCVGGAELQVDIVSGSVSITGAVDTELTTDDLDTGAGTDTRAVVGLVGSASGGGQLIPGSATDGLLVNLGANNDVSVTGTVTVDNAGTFAVQAAQSGTWNITNVSGTVSLPTGASTAAKQPALGVAGTPSVDVITVQGIAAMTALKVDGSAVTQPVSAASLPLPSGAATSALQTTGNTSLSTIAGAVAGTEMQVDVLTMPTVTVDSELPAAALLADNTATPTAPAVGAFLMVYDGATWDLLRGDSTNGMLVNLGANNDVTVTGTVAVTQSGTWNITQLSQITTSIVPGTSATHLGKAEDAAHTTGDTGVFILGVRNDGTTQTSRTSTAGDYSPISTDTYGNMLAVGNIPHDGVDDGNPVKIGAKTRDYQPVTSDEVSGGLAEVAELDRANISANLRGEIIEGVNGYFYNLDNVSTTYNNTTTTATSTGKECWNYRFATIAFTLVSANTPTDIQFDVEISCDNGANYAKLYNGPLGLWIYDDTAVSSSKGIALTFPIACTHIRLKVTATGTDASNTFTVSAAKVYLRN